MSEDIVRHLEEKIAYLEHHVTEQDKVMLEFSDDLARLRRELSMLAARLAGTAPAGQGGDELPTDERPPHY